jgi:hypothetical protein
MDEYIKAALYVYDSSQPFDQVFLNKPKDAWEIRELRLSKTCWLNLLEHGHKDAYFMSVTTMEQDKASLDSGFVATAAGVRITTEWVMEQACAMTPLPGMTYLMMYVPVATQPTPTPAPINLLNLAQQVTSP